MELFTGVQSSSFATSLVIIARISAIRISFWSIQKNRKLLVSTPFGAFVFLSDILIQTHVWIKKYANIKKDKKLQRSKSVQLISMTRQGKLEACFYPAVLVCFLNSWLIISLHSPLVHYFNLINTVLVSFYSDTLHLHTGVRLFLGEVTSESKIRNSNVAIFI